MVVSYEGGTKSLPMFWFVSGFLSTSCGQRGRCVCVCVCISVRGWVCSWREGNECWGQCLPGQVFSFFFFMLQAREQRGNSNQNNPGALAWEMCPTLPKDILSALRERSQQLDGAGGWGRWVIAGSLTCPPPHTHPGAQDTWDNISVRLCILH